MTDWRHVASRAGCRRLVLEPAGQVGGWVASVFAARLYLYRLAAVLGDVERRRLSQVSNRARAEAYVVGHGLLRHLLSESTGRTCHPAAWQFATTDAGKPLLWSEGCRDHDVSLAYSADAIAIAIAHRRAIGVDIEAVRSGPIPWALLNERERQRLLARHGGDRQLEFLRLWTIREAVAKCRGVGLAREIAADDPASRLVQRFRIDADEFLLAVATHHAPDPFRPADKDVAPQGAVRTGAPGE